MRVYAIFAQDKKESLNRTIYNNVTQHLQSQGAEIDKLDLYKHADEIPFFWHNKKKRDENPFYQENKERFMKADRLLLVFPVYWYSTPGIMKCWIDQITNYAYRLEQGYYAHGLHNIKKTLTINTTMTPVWFNHFILGNPANNQIKQTFKFMGIYKNYFYQIGDTRNLNNKKVHKHLEKIKKLSNSLL